MKTRNSTKSKLLSSVIALVLCVSMLIGATFAWFTDTASTGVNKIQAGTLDVGLEMLEGTTWSNAEGQTLKWTRASGSGTELADSTEILWEPGCTYDLQDIRVVNKGNLALKYRIVITGIDGSAELNNAIEWTITKGGTETSLDSNEYFLLPANETGDTISISGHMKEDAGNEYQGKFIDGIGITVYATQYAAEYDSNDNQYDKDALYSVLVAGVNRTEEKDADVNAQNETTADITLTSGTIPAATKMYKDSEKSVPLTSEDITGKLQEDIKTTGSGDSVTFDISYTYVKSDNTTTKIHGFSKALTHTFNLSKGLQEVTVTHSGASMTPKDDVEALQDGEYNYNASTGVLTIMSSTYSKFEVTYKYDFVAATGGQGYATLAEAIDAAKDGETVVLLKSVEIKANEYNVNNRLYVNANNLTIDLGDNTLTVPNHTLTLSGDNITLKNGTMIATTTSPNQTYGSYVVAANGKNTTITNLTTMGGISVNGYNQVDDTLIKADVSAIITDCQITATNYYTVCAQGEASATVSNSTLIGTSGYAFFWVEKGFTDEYGTVKDSSLTYEIKTVTMTGDKPLYNTGGIAPIAVVYVTTEAELKSAFANAEDGHTIIFKNNISITKTGTYGNGTPDTYILAKNAVIDLNGKTLTVNSNDSFMLAGDNNTIKNGTILSGPATNQPSGKISYALGVTAGSKNALIENITIDGGIEVLGNGTTATLKNVTSTATNYYNIYLAGGATATVDGGSYNSATGKVHFYTQTLNDKVIVNSGSFSGGNPTHSGSGSFADNRQS